MLYLLNTPILTDYGKYYFVKITVDEAKELLAKENFISAIGHKGTAELMTKLFGIEISINRIAIKMLSGDTAIVFRVLERLEEGKILTDEELKKVNYEIGFLRKSYTFLYVVR